MTPQEYEDKLTQFSRTIEAESDHRVIVVKNRIAGALAYEYKAIERIESINLCDNGKVVFSLLKKVMSKLEAEGIEF